MNKIAMQIDFITEELTALNKLLAAREKLRQLQAAVSITKPGTFRSVANEMACNQLAYVISLEREYQEMYAPA